MFFYSCLLNPTGTLLPERIFLMGQLVYSEELPKMVSVKDENIQRFTESKSSDNTVSRIIVFYIFNYSLAQVLP